MKVGKGVFAIIVVFSVFIIFFISWKLFSNEKSELGNQKEIGESVLLNEQELKQKIGQMIMVGFRGTEAGSASAIAKAIRELNLGGVALFDYDVPSGSFPRNILNPEQVQKLTADLQILSPNTLLIALDAEGGRINRLKEKYGFNNIPSHQALGKEGSEEKVFQEAEKLAKQLKALGFNVNFAPVVDLNINPDNPVIGDLERSFSADPLKVAELAGAFIRAHQKQGVISVIKHFPGHGSSKNDSHLGLVDITNTWQAEELIPYQQLLGESSDEPMAETGSRDKLAVITGHLMNKKIDSNLPATLSPLFLQNILKQQIGFQGVIISDDMQMGAVAENFGFEESIIKAINAGCDILLFSNNSSQPYDENLAFKVHQIIFEAVKKGEISQGRIDQAYQKIQNLKTNI